MPDFFEAMKRMVQGKPVFTPDDVGAGGERSDNKASTTPYIPPDPNTPKEPPKVVIERIEYRSDDDDHMELDFIIQNNSDQEVFLDRVRLLGTKFELDRQLKPGEEKEFTVYRGPRPNNNNYDKCAVEYRDTTGNYFSAHHILEFDDQPDGTYIVNDARFIPPVQDI